MASCCLTRWIVLAVGAGSAFPQQLPSRTSTIPKTWDEKALADWATPLAHIGVRPSHTSSAQYYALPVDNLKTWPVYLRGREPEGYWQMLQRIGPQPMIEPDKLKTQEDWRKAGRTVFEQMDHLHLRTLDPAYIDIVRRGDLLVPSRMEPPETYGGFPQKKALLPKVRRSDEVLYALSLYLQTLKPPPNPNPVNQHSVAGEKIFRREGCSGCHVPPLYTNNKLTLAEGFQPPKVLPAHLDVLPFPSVPIPD